MGEEKKVHKVLVGNPKGKRPVGKLRCRWDSGIKMDLGETGKEGVGCTHLAPG
jgi:hypothetical protein